MSKQLLSGNEALARGAWEAGVLVAAAYPGTPSTEILETLAPMPGVYAEWCPNEKVALDVAIGAAYAGVRAMAVMKHVGVNVAADALFYAAMTGLEAGLVVAVADDPGMHSSQGEQDTRRYAKFARVPCLEPSDSQEAKDLVAEALALSERFDTPVFVRLTTRISHSHSVVELGPERDPELGQERPDYRVDTTKYVMVPGNARRRHPVMEERSRQIAEFAETFAYNRVEMGERGLGIVTNGVAYQYAKEVFPQASILRLGMTWPIPARLVSDFAAQVDRLIVIEELDPFIEEELKILGIPCEGKSIFPAIDELSPQVVRHSAIAAGLLSAAEASEPLELRLPELPPRPPLLCPGCPHRGVFAVTRKLKLVVSGDIGCYTLGFLPPLGALHTCGCMGASIGQAHGVAKAHINQKHVAVIGDSTFFHTGMPALLNVAYNKSNTVTIILDNRTTAMTGHQEHPGTGRTLQQEPAHAVDLAALVRAMGIEDVYVVDPYDLAEVEETLRACIDKDGPAVVIAQRECVLLPEARRRHLALRVDPDACRGCGLCLQLGCPALSRSDRLVEGTRRYAVQIDPLLCTGCELCAQICNNDAIATRAIIEAERAAQA
ncbi:MAG: indolepyruvate ferredoxin oxidoreductase subunit alpha [Anaerolineae bacterium]|nr:indolepyruvate ferredoxin oxidoreductase subunit alpha [Anaerolineae bacterium]